MQFIVFIFFNGTIYIFQGSVFGKFIDGVNNIFISQRIYTAIHMNYIIVFKRHDSILCDSRPVPSLVSFPFNLSPTQFP